MKLDTVRIVAADAPGGFLTINRRDFDPVRHRLWPEAAEAAEPDAKNTDAGEKRAEGDKEANAKEPGKTDAVRAARAAK